MIEGIHVSSEFVAFSRRHSSLRLFLRTVPGAGALALSLLTGAWTLTALPFAAPEAPAAASAPTLVPNPFGAMLVDLRSRSRSVSASLEQSAPPEAKPEPVLSASINISTPTAVIPAAENLPSKSGGPVFPARRERAFPAASSGKLR